MAKRARKPKDLTPLELTALKIVAKRADKLRDELEEGTGQPVDFIVHVTGAVDVGLTQASITSRKPSAEVMLGAVLLDLGPRQVAGMLRALETRMKQLAAGPLPGLEPELMDEIERLVVLGTASESGTKRGNVTGSLAVERVP